MNPIAFIPLTSAVISLVFSVFVFRRYLEKHHTHNLLWSIGMLFYAIGGACEAFYGFLGWNPLVFRLWYLFGALLVAAWLGQGTVYLLAKPRLANILMVVLALGSLYGAYRVFTAQLDPAGMISSLHTGSELSALGDIYWITPLNLLPLLLLVALSIRKSIPVSGGMAGGSADAAAMSPAVTVRMPSQCTSAELTRVWKASDARIAALDAAS